MSFFRANLIGLKADRDCIPIERNHDLRIMIAMNHVLSAE